jgi:glutaredoxin 3
LIIKAVMYCTRRCPFCRMADELLAEKGVMIEKIHVDDLPARRAEMVRITGRTTVPQIFIDEAHVGGYTELAKLDVEGRLDELLAGDRRASA